MNNWQMFFAASAPTVAVLVGILLNERRADRTDAHITRIEVRIEQGENRLEARIEQGENRLEARIEQGENRLEARIDRMSDDLKVFYRDLGRHEADIVTLKQRS